MLFFAIVFTVEGLARLALLQDQPAQAVCLVAWADVIRESIDNPRPQIEQADTFVQHIDRFIAGVTS